VIEVGVVAMDGVQVTNSSNIAGGQPAMFLGRGRHEITLELDTILLPRQYSFFVSLSHLSGLTIEWIERALDFDVLRVAESGGDSYRWTNVRGYVRPTSRWFEPQGSITVDSENTDAARDLVAGGTS
jgi:hypothetical protein